MPSAKNGLHKRLRLIFSDFRLGFRVCKFGNLGKDAGRASRGSTSITSVNDEVVREGVRGGSEVKRMWERGVY